MAAPDAKEKEHVQDGRKMTMSSPDVRIVRLNIGGYKYATTRATLLSVPSSYFEALLEERVPTPKDEKGAYFIDRDGQYFPPILTYLRTKELHVPMSDRRAVLREAKFYLLAPVVQLLQGVITQDEEIQASRWHAHAQKVPPAAYVDPHSMRLLRCQYFEQHESKIDQCIQKLISKGRTEAKVKITAVDQDGPPSAPPNADLIVFPIRGASAQTIEEVALSLAGGNIASARARACPLSHPCISHNPCLEHLHFLRHSFL